MKTIDCTTKNIDAATHTLASAAAGGAYAAQTSPAAITPSPAHRIRRDRDESRAKRGNVAAPSAAASHGIAASRPTTIGLKRPDSPMMPGRKKIIV